MNDNKPPIDWSDRLVGFGAGLSSALIFAASTRGTGLAIALAYVCVLPLLIGAAGFSVAAAAAGAAAGGLFLGLAGEPLLGFSFCLGFALPGALLGLLARWTYRRKSPEPTLLPARLSPGALLAGAVVLATLSAWTLAGGLIWSSGGFDRAFDAALQEYGPALDKALTKFARIAPQIDLDMVKRVAVLGFPAAVAASQTLLLTFNLWLAARAVDISGRLGQPWPPLPETTALPRWFGLAFLGALALCFVNARTAVFAGAFASASGLALAMQGLACAHALTRGHSSRGGWLATVYAVALVGVTVAPPLLLLFVLFGLAESALSLRARKARAKPEKKTGESNGSDPA
ncbi:Predicted membrane protein [Rhodoblastus acidophilus]|uniref:Predicted membrane protein n=1 Tax=Rhodoblastus acidophilus TaxID=1074 RepID=A0A212RG52_RHOAC|nr:DUF2232 domain-containing protein [Rhodoblastus acidophilus]PPQ39624.1 DUF2232 domain-containing protein [Rhodoblastus acidophilus]RAI24406.1 DUF2232 domain-containing protein [Rhodoblastus acidophilus]SNB71327.1 Predicted membrane protein [Rhodoblastus acidophilus]